MGKEAIIGVGQSKFMRKYPGSIRELAFDGFKEAVTDARISFTQTTKVNDFVDHLEAGRVMVSRGTECRETYFPPRADCCRCLFNKI